MKILDGGTTCCGCNTTFLDRKEFEEHDCMEMMKPKHHLDCLMEKGEWRKGKPKCVESCEVLLNTN